jgi:hypothetical protein
MAKRLIFNGPEGQVLDESGQKVPSGEEFTVDDDRAAWLLANPQIPVIEAGDSLEQRSRQELNELASEAGVWEPEKFPNKAAVIAAIEQSQADLAEGDNDSGDPDPGAGKED